MFWSKARFFLNWSARLKITSGSNTCNFWRNRSRSSKNARCCTVCPSSARAASTWASVFQSGDLQLQREVVVQRQRRLHIKQGQYLEFFFIHHLVRLNLPVNR
jgi:hypothetical protein